MKPSPRTAVIALIIGIVLFLGWRALDADGRERRAIERRLHELATHLEKSGPTSLISTGASAVQFLDYFTPNAEVDLDYNGHNLNGHNALKSTYLLIHRQVDTLSLTLTESRIDLAPDRRSATATVLVSVRATHTSHTESERREYVLSLEKHGDWKIRRAEHAKPLLRR